MIGGWSDKMRDPVLQARARKGVAARRGDAEGVRSASRDLTAAKLERHIREAVAAAPPLTNDQRARLAALLRPQGGERS